MNRRYREIQIGHHTIIAADPLPDVRHAPDAISGTSPVAH
jgi:hypothetical protein